MKINLDFANTKLVRGKPKKSKASLMNSISTKCKGKKGEHDYCETDRTFSKKRTSLSNKKLNSFLRKKEEGKQAEFPSQMNLYERFKKDRMTDLSAVGKTHVGMSSLIERREKRKQRGSETLLSQNTSFHTLHNVLNNLNNRTKDEMKEDNALTPKAQTQRLGFMKTARTTLRKNSLLNTEDINSRAYNNKSLNVNRLLKRDKLENQTKEIKGMVHSITDFSVEKTSRTLNSPKSGGLHGKQNSSINLNVNFKFKIEGLTNNNKITFEKQKEKKSKNLIDISEESVEKKKIKKNSDCSKYKAQKAYTGKGIGYKSLLPRRNSLMNLSYFMSTESNKPSYYIKTMLKTLENKILLGRKNDDYYRELYFHHFRESYLHYSHLNRINVEEKLDKVESVVSVFKNSRKKTKELLVLDLDETLVFCSYKQNNKEALETKVPGTYQKIFIHKRPYLDEFLSKMSKFYTLVIYTAGEKNYANAVIDAIDPENAYITHRIFRDKCVSVNQRIMLKTLKVITDLDYNKTVFVDNLSCCFYSDINNGVPIISFSGDVNDKELQELEKFLTLLHRKRDFRKLISKTFQFENLMKTGNFRSVIDAFIEGYKKLN